MSDVSLPEHPEATQRRLRESGDWTEAEDLFKDVRQRHYNRYRRDRKNGYQLTIEERVEANKAAWDEVYKKWPPPAEAAPLNSLAHYLDNTHRIRKGKYLPRLSQADEERFDQIGEPDDLTGEALWVYANIEKNDIDPQTCPSRGAWSMLKHARRDKGWFYEKIWRPVAQQLSKQKAAANDGEYKASKAEKLAVAELDSMIQEAVSASGQSA
jgi:hypothetical protein